MAKYTLNICYSTYCRGEVFLKDILQLLENEDGRFRVTVQDNHSEDGSFERLSEIKDYRFNLRRNEKNLGNIPNSQRALSDNPDAEYLLFSLDKDFVNPKYLSSFIDYLETNKPDYGHLNLYKPDNQSADVFSKGYDAISNLAYLSKHPSGFFWRKDLLYAEMQKPFFNKLSRLFDWWYDLVTAHIAVKYDGQVVNIPLFIHAPFRKEYQGILVPTLSFNENNIYFGFPKRMESYELFMTDMISLELPKEDLEKASFHLLKRTLHQTTTFLRAVYHKKDECLRYNLRYRTISFTELHHNIVVVLKKYNQLMRDRESKISLLGKSLLAYTCFTLFTAKFCLTEKYEKS